MPLFMDTHEKVEGLTAEAFAMAHKMDLAVQDEHGVKHLAYWLNEELGRVYCLVEAPSDEEAQAVHREAHGLLADQFIQVRQGS